jgi:hypothetical protein
LSNFGILISDYETLRALDADNVPSVPSMSEEEINALPVHKYKIAGPQKYFSFLNLIFGVGHWMNILIVVV